MIEHGTLVKWVCPKCNTVNYDILEATCFPLCENCMDNTEWETILADPKTVKEDEVKHD